MNWAIQLLLIWQWPQQTASLHIFIASEFGSAIPSTLIIELPGF